MKKLVFAAITAIVMVSVSNVFANGSSTKFQMASPTDTTAIDTVVPEQQEETADTSADAINSNDDTAFLMLSDSTITDSTSILGSDSSAIAML